MTTDLAEIEAYLKTLSPLNFEHNRKIIHKSGVKQIHLTKHARQRWNTRVAPANISNQDLIKFLNGCLSLGRIELFSKQCGVIDNEIVFIYEQDEEQLNIITFYGRISHRPALSNIKKLKTFNYRELDDVNFELSKAELHAQALPPLPYKRLIFRGNYVVYSLDVYDNDRDVFFHLNETSFKGNESRIFRLQDENLQIGKSTVTALRIMGYLPNR
jgi:hypothetical protein